MKKIIIKTLPTLAMLALIAAAGVSGYNYHHIGTNDVSRLPEAVDAHRQVLALKRHQVCVEHEMVICGVKHNVAQWRCVEIMNGERIVGEC